MSVIDIRELSKTFGSHGSNRAKNRQDVVALSGVDLKVEEGEFVTLLGPSGCGKTTLLRMIAGLETPTSGTVEVGGQSVAGPAPDRAMVFQSFALMPWASALRNAAFGLELAGIGREERNARARKVLKLVGLSGFEERLPAELSGGMQQRVGLARALAVDPETLLMDEPFGALDEQTKRIMQEELLAIWEQDRKTVVFVTHSIEEAILLGDRVVVMSARPGRIAETITVPLGRPRTRADESQPEFVEIKARLWETLRDLQVADAV